MLRDKLSKSSVYNDEIRFIGTDTPNLEECQLE